MNISGLEWLEPISVFGMLLCIFIAVLAYKQKSPAIMLVSSLGWVILAFQVFHTAQDEFILALMFMVAFSQFFLTWGKVK